MKNDLPSTLQEAIRYFTSDVNCHNFMVNLLWPDGKITCPHCQSQNVGKLVVTQHKSRSKAKEGETPKMLTRRLWNCKGCKKQFTTKTNTIFEQSPLSLDKWLPAVWEIVNCKNGMSSYEIHRALGVTQKTAWFMGHRIRLALHEGSFVKMSGAVEADETFIGAKARNMHKNKKEEKNIGTGGVGKTAVMGLLERNVRKQCSRVKLKVLKTTKRKELHGHVKDYVLKGSALYTDALRSYNGLRVEYEHQVVDHAVCYAKGHVHTNGLENFWSLLKRMVKGTYVCPREWHLFRYLDEMAYRFNERKGVDQDRFIGAMQGVSGKRLTYSCLRGDESALHEVA